MENVAAKLGLKISYEKIKIMTTDQLIINNVMINGNKMDIVERLKYVGEMINNNVYEKAAWDERTKELSKV